MNCDQFQDHISDYLDGALAGREAAAFNEHKLGCPDCRGLLDDVAEAVRACAQEPDVEPPLQIMSRALVIPLLNPPIDCERVESLVTEFLDGYLEPAVYHAFERHVNGCASCSETLAGVALAVSACHSVHFSETLEVPDGLVAGILAETTGWAAGAASRSRFGAVWGRLQTVFGFGMFPAASQRLATAGLIVLAMYGVHAVNGGSFTPAELYKDAARLSSRVYNHSSELASETTGVLAEVDRIRSRVDEMLREPERRRPTAAEQGA
jgi:predicted anti-sigma-YlaC factor YlaD